MSLLDHALAAPPRPRRAFDPRDLLPARAFPRTRLAVAIPPAQRRSILFAASQDTLPSAWLEIIGLAAPAEGADLALALHRGGSTPDLLLGRMRLAARPTPGRRSRQLPLTTRQVAQIAAAGASEILAAWRAPDGRITVRCGLACLSLGLVFESPLPSPPYPLV